MRKLHPRYVLTASILIALLASLTPGTALATGFGAYFEYGHDWTAGGGQLGNAATLSGNSPAFRAAFDRNEFGIGFALDTNLAKDRVFNYRLDLGFHIDDWTNNAGPPFLGYTNGYGLMWNNAFGFGVVRTENFRLWIGPAARMNVDYYSNANPFLGNLADIVDFQVGVGPQIGFNTHLGRHLTTTLSVAYNYKWGWYFAPNSVFFTNTSFSHTDNYVGVNLAFFFRTSGDQFDAGR